MPKTTELRICGVRKTQSSSSRCCVLCVESVERTETKLGIPTVSSHSYFVLQSVLLAIVFSVIPATWLVSGASMFASSIQFNSVSTGRETTGFPGTIVICVFALCLRHRLIN